MSRLVLISYTPIDAPGGVPRFNRDIMSTFPNSVHYSWSDVEKAFPTWSQQIDPVIPEWNKARVLNQWLIWSKQIHKDDVILVDGFWGLGLEDFPNVVSVAHGNWSHTTLEDVQAGIPPEFPEHHAVQLKYRRDHIARNGRIVAVSRFIAHQCFIQWGMEMPVINNGIDLEMYRPSLHVIDKPRPIIVHFTTTVNKGLDHIRAVEEKMAGTADVYLLDDLYNKYKGSGLSKYELLAHADLVVHPSAHEGNSYAVLETLACDVPIVSYNVGLMYEAWVRGDEFVVGAVSPRDERSPTTTAFNVDTTLWALNNFPRKVEPRAWVSEFSIENFRHNWSNYMRHEFGDGVGQ